MVKVVASEKIAAETGNKAARVTYTTNEDLFTLANEFIGAEEALIKNFAYYLARLERHGAIPIGQGEKILDLMEETLISNIEDAKKDNQNISAWDAVCKEITDAASEAEASMEDDETTRAMSKLASAQADMELAMSKADSSVVKLMRHSG